MDLTGSPGEIAWLVIHRGHSPTLRLDCGGTLVPNSSYYILLLAGTLGPSGNLTYKVKVPELGVGVDSVPFVVQGVLVSSNRKKCQLASPSSTLLLDRRF